ncbi:Cytochrome P450 [Haloplanus vescus]|uniref:Cytochrome P450 n=1 Tax=Haloplanus vescus TaxID=555874 RepID=A0A1H3WQX2_9EURY|nr:cytochrome P450 [Haloplanus vescus]SDZ88588.1 Cytochrome P450 [Haloplanus vescus]
MSRTLPEPPDAGMLNAIRFGSDTFRFLEGVQARYPDGAAVPIPGRAPLVVVTNPELVHDALSRPDDFRRVPAQASAALIAENGLVQSDGPLWRQQRRIMNPAFDSRQVKTYANEVGRRVEGLADDWADRVPFETNLHRAMTQLTVRVASEVLLGEDIGPERAAQFHEWMQTAGAEFEFDLTSVAPDWLPDRISPEFREAAEGIRGLSEDIIDRRRDLLAEGDDDVNLVTMLLRAADDPDVDYPPNQIRDEVATFLIAGHETTALSLTYTLALLSWHPECRERVRDEAAALNSDSPTHDDLSSLPYTQRVYREALRLYPPAWATFRRASRPVRLGDYRVPEGAAVVMPQWSIQRSGRHFEAPTTFDPDRWERRSPTDTPAYFPFSTGPHACVGRNFALSGATLTLARLVREFDIEVAEDALDDLRITPTLRPVGGVPARIRPAD